jgi:DNA-binding HxlR family transcriptional regulator
MSERSYQQFCGIAHALDLVGERWALLVVRELLVGPRRFTDLLDGLPRIGTNVLTARLKELERAGVVQRRTLPPPAASKVYELTDYGRQLETPLLALGRWGAMTLGSPEPGHAVRPERLALILRGLFEPQRAATIQGRYELRIGQTSVYLQIADGSLDSATEPSGPADAVVATDFETFIALARRELSVEQAATEGQLRLEGDPRLSHHFFEVFSIPYAT